MYKRKLVTQETAFNYVNDDEHEAWFSSNEKKWINRLYRLNKESPDDVKILETPDKNGGYIMAEIPKDYFVLRKPKKRIMTDKQKNEARERMSVARQAKSSPIE